MHYNDSVTIRNTAMATANGTTQRQNLCAATDIVTTTCSVLTYYSIATSITMPSHQNRAESNQIPPAKQPSKHRCVSTVINAKSESNSIPPHRPATRSSLSRCQPRPMCSSSFRLAFQRCRLPVVPFVQQRDDADAGAGADRTTITCYQSVNSAITTKLCC